MRADILRKRGNHIDLFEVKAKSFDSGKGSDLILKKTGISSEFKPYLYDVAFQRHVLRLAFPETTIASHLIMPDKDKRCTEPRLAQRLRVERSGPRSVEINIHKSLQDGALARQLLCVLPVDEFLDVLTQSELQAGGYTWAFDEGILELEACLDGAGLDARPGSHCKNCEFRLLDAAAQGELRDGVSECLTSQFKVSADELASGSIFDLYNFRGVKPIIESDRILLRDLEPEDVKYKEAPDKISLSHRQWLQCEEARGVALTPIALKGELAGKLESLKFPIHFIDFETATPPLPFHSGMHPYELLFFQFSHHQMEANGKVTHKSQHLEPCSATFPNFDAVRSLARAVGRDNGSVVHWWTHERTVLTKVREQLQRSDEPPMDREELIEFIIDLVGNEERPGRLVDLGQHIVHPFVFMPGTKGSSSIKKILPAMLNSSTLLQDRYAQPLYGVPEKFSSMNFDEQVWVTFDGQGRVKDPYTILQGRFQDPDLDSLEDRDESSSIVANGGAAMAAYSLLQSDLLGEEERAELVRQLLRYCELDTLAMVMAYQGLQELVS